MSNKSALSTDPVRILIIGTLLPPPTGNGTIPSVGGGSVSLKFLLDQLSTNPAVDVQIVDTFGIRGNRLTGLSRLARVVYRVLISSFQVDVTTLHCASTALPLFGLVVLAMARLARKPFVVRKFAGFDYMDLGHTKGWLAHFVVRHSDLYLAQTKRLVHLANKRGLRHVEWYPTSRPMSKAMSPVPAMRGRCKRFVYVGQVREYKGIRELLEAAERMEDTVSVDVYGPFFNDINRDIFMDRKRVKYCGLLNPEEVVPTLEQYDALILPTKAQSEGYPGIILEGYSSGLPVIATTCGAIPEIVDETSGILVESQNVEALYHAMRRLCEDEDLYKRLCVGASAKGHEFDTTTWTDRFVEYCRKLVKKPNAV